MLIKPYKHSRIAVNKVVFPAPFLPPIENVAIKKERIEKIQAMIEEGCSEELIQRIGYTKEEFLEAKQHMLQSV